MSLFFNKIKDTYLMLHNDHLLDLNNDGVA